MARPGLTQHRKFLRLSRTLGNAPLALGCLEFLWEKCYQNGDDYLGDKVDVEAAAQWPGKPGDLCRALLAAGGDGNLGFIEEIEGRSGHFRCHDLYHHAPKYVSKRLERELERKEKGVTISQLRAEAGRKGAAAKHGKREATGQHQEANGQQTMANGRQIATTPAPAPAPAPGRNPSSELNTCSDQVSSSRGGKTERAPSQEASRLAGLLKSEIQHNKADYRITPAQERKWSTTAQRMLEIDRRDPEEIAVLIRWVQHDEFWMANVLSMDTLREKFDQLQLKQRQSGNQLSKLKGPHHDGNGNGNRAERRQADNIAAAEKAVAILERRMAH